MQKKLLTKFNVPKETRKIIPQHNKCSIYDILIDTIMNGGKLKAFPISGMRQGVYSPYSYQI
jgi:hypothetical protein